jgi:hypothetical protein
VARGKSLQGWSRANRMEKEATLMPGIQTTILEIAGCSRVVPGQWVTSCVDSLSSPILERAV